MDTIEGRVWRLAALIVDGGRQPVPEGITATIEFADGRVYGSPGCNRMHGECAISDEELLLGPVATTLMACPPPAGDVERFVLDVLCPVTPWRMVDAELTIGTGELGLIYA